MAGFLNYQLVLCMAADLSNWVCAAIHDDQSKLAELIGKKYREKLSKKSIKRSFTIAGSFASPSKINDCKFF